MSPSLVPADEKANVLLVGSGGVGTMATYAMEIGGRAAVTAVCRSNYLAVEKAGFSIDSIEHGQGIRGFRPSASTQCFLQSSFPGTHSNHNLDSHEVRTRRCS